MKKTASAGSHADSSKSLLKKSGLKATPGRLEVLAILKRTHAPLSADALTLEIRSSGIDRATVYRTLTSFADAGIVRKVALHTGAEHFELDDDHHHHLVCTECGTIEGFDACDIEETAKSILRHSSFKTIRSHSLELFGVCKKCAA